MITSKKFLWDMDLNGTLILDDQDGLFVRSSYASFWDSSFEVFGNPEIGIDNDHNRCVLRIMCPGPGEIYIDGAQYSGFYIEIRFCGPCEYRGCLDWFERMGAKATEIKRRGF